MGNRPLGRARLGLAWPQGIGLNEQIFGANEQLWGQGQSD